MLFTGQVLRAAAVAVGLVGVLGMAASAQAVTNFNLPLTDGASNPLDLGLFSAGTQLHITASGTGDMVNSNYEVNPDGTLAAAAMGAYTFANFGATYPVVNGGDGINHFVGGGATYDFSGSGYPFAGPMTTDTTDPTDIRFGAVVGTFTSTPSRTDWFYVGPDALVTVPAGGAHLYLAVNDTNNTDNHGTFAGTFDVVTPEPASLTLVGLGAAGLLRRRRSR